jgi:hypothetical protein
VEEAAWSRGFLRCARGGLDCGEPYGADVKYIKRCGVEVAGRRYELSGAVHIVGFGKAPLKMAQAVVDVLGVPWLALSFRRWAATAWAPSRNCIATTQSRRRHATRLSEAPPVPRVGGARGSFARLDIGRRLCALRGAGGGVSLRDVA